MGVLSSCMVSVVPWWVQPLVEVVTDGQVYTWGDAREGGKQTNGEASKRTGQLAS